MGKKKIIEKIGKEPSLDKEKKEKQESAVPKIISGGGKKIESGKIYINASYNNTVITITDLQGNVLAWISAGSMGFSGPKKATPFAAAKAVEAVSEKVRHSGPVNVSIIVKGVGAGRDSAIRSFIHKGFNVLSIKDLTPIPHNGPRPPKRRRV